MTFDDQHVDASGVDDRRGGGGFGGLGMSRGVAIGGGGRIVAVIITLLAVFLGGGTAGETASDLQQRCNTDGAIQRYDDWTVLSSPIRCRFVPAAPAWLSER